MKSLFFVLITENCAVGAEWCPGFREKPVLVSGLGEGSMRDLMGAGERV